jgi:hypothetical protein
VAALTRLLGAPEECVKCLSDGDLRAYIFRRQDGFVAIAWCGAGQGVRGIERLPDKVRVFDVMGNAVAARNLRLGESPVYFVASDASDIIQLLSDQP